MGDTWGTGCHVHVVHSVTTVLVLVGSVSVCVFGGVVRSTWGVVLAAILVLGSVCGNVGMVGRLLHAVMAWSKTSAELLMGGGNSLTVGVCNSIHWLRLRMGMVDGLGWVIVVFSSITLHSKES